MSRGINRVTLIGTVGKDVELRYFQSGDAYCTVSLATNESWKDKEGNKQEKTEWHNVKFTRRLAEIVGEYVKKGSQIYVEGKLETQKYTDKQGVERYATSIVANEMQLLGGRSERSNSQSDFSEQPAQSQSRQSQAPSPARQPAPAPAGDFDETWNPPF